jgi:hypothetical protein
MMVQSRKIVPVHDSQTDQLETEVKRLEEQHKEAHRQATASSQNTGGKAQ